MQTVINNLLAGKQALVATDTLYALTCDATNQKAVAEIYRLKGRDEKKKLPILFKDLAQVKEHCYLPLQLEKLALEFWPGPLTMLLQVKKVSNLAKEAYEDDILAARIPGSSTMSDLLASYNQPLIGTSANLSGADNSLDLLELKKNFDGLPILYDDRKPSGTPSTIVKLDEDFNLKLVRQGAIPFYMILFLQ